MNIASDGYGSGLRKFDTDEDTIMTDRTRNRFDETKTAVAKVERLQTSEVFETGPYIVSSGQEAMDDVVTPSFHARIRDGEVINNPMSYSSESYGLSANECKYSWWPTADPSDKWVWLKGNVSAYMLAYESSPYMPDNNEAPAISFPGAMEARNKSLANVDSTPYEFLEDVAEIRETILFLRNPLAAISNLARAYKRKRNRAENIKDAISRAEALSDLWAQYQWAFKPLVRTLWNAYEALGDSDSIRPGRRNAHGYSSDKTDDDRDIVSKTGGVGTEMVYHWHKSSERSANWHASILYEVSNPVFDTNFKLGLRRKDIPRGMWDIFPLSFMIDRLWDIGNMISAFVNLADPAVSILTGSVTERSLSTHTLSLIGRSSSYGSTGFSLEDQDHVRWETFDMNRAPWSPDVTDLVAPITFGRPFKDIQSILDLIAVAMTRLK